MAFVGQQANLYRTNAAVELTIHNLEIRISGPGKVVNVFGVKGDGFGSIGIIVCASLHASRTNDVALRQRDLHVVSAEIGKKLSHRVELMAIPCPVPPHADLGKPLSGEQEGALVASAGDHLRENRMELYLEDDVLSGWDRAGKLDFKDGLVVGIAIIGRDKLDLLGEVPHADNFKRGNVVRPAVLRVPRILEGGGAEVSVAMRFVHPCGLGLKAVQVKVKGEVIQRLAGQVVIGQRLGSINRVLVRIVLRVDHVGDHALRQRSGNFWSERTLRTKEGGDAAEKHQQRTEFPGSHQRSPAQKQRKL